MPDQTHIIKGSAVDAAGGLKSPGEFTGTIKLDEAKILNLFAAKHIIMMATLQTSRNTTGGATDVKFMASYGLSVDVGISLTLNLKVE